jgi:L-arabinonolactonase
VKISRLGTESAAVGESPVWDVSAQALYYIDVLGKLVLRYDPRSNETGRWSLPGIVGSVALRERGGVIVALEDGIYGLELDSGMTRPLARIPRNPRIQFTDGKVDRKGRFLVGTFDWRMTDPIGSLFRLDTDGTLQSIDHNYVCSNGPCWSPDSSVFYHADSKTYTIFAYDYDLESGSVSNRRVFTNTQTLGGLPDGATVDSDGCLWVALPPSSKIACYDPNAKIERIVNMPIPMPASVMFGGANLDLLYVTSIDPSVIETVDGSPRVRECPVHPRDHDNGGLFVIEGLGARGLPESRYCG